MPPQSTLLILDSVLNECKRFLDILQDCKYIRDLKYEWEIISFKSDILDEALTNYKGNDILRHESFANALKELINNMILIEQTLIKSSRKTRSEEIYKDSGNMFQLRSIEEGLCSEANQIYEKHLACDSKHIGMNSTLRDTKLTKNECNICRKRFATKELLSYHLVHLHEIIKPG